MELYDRVKPYKALREGIVFIQTNFRQDSKAKKGIEFLIKSATLAHDNGEEVKQLFLYLIKLAETPHCEFKSHIASKISEAIQYGCAEKISQDDHLNRFIWVFQSYSHQRKERSCFPPFYKSKYRSWYDHWGH